MAALEDIGLNTASIKSFGMNVIIGGGIIIFLILMGVGMFLLIRHLMRYSQFNVTIFYKDSNNQWMQKKDKGGVFINNKTKSRLLHLKNAKTVMNPDYIPFLIEKGKKVIYLKEVGIRNYVYLKHSFKENDVNITVGEEDVNAAIQDFEVATRVLKANWEQYIPLIATIFAMAILLIVMIVYANKWQEVMMAGQGAAVENAKAMAEWARQLAVAKSGATIVNP